MTVHFAHGKLAYFRRKARRNPTEIMAILMGVHDILLDRAEVCHVEYPELEISTATQVTIGTDEMERMYDLAEELGLSIIGTLHSHPDAPPVCSPTDANQFEHNRWPLVGICEVPRIGKTRVIFWTADTPVPCRLKVAA